jgi:hypothetical protein
MQPIVDTDSLLKPVSPRKNHPPRCSALFSARVHHLLLLLGVLQDALGFQAPPCLLKSPGLNAAQFVSTSIRSVISAAHLQCTTTYLVSGLNQ